MNITRDGQRERWAALEHTTSGREQIAEAYARVIGDYGGWPSVRLSYNEMIEAILERFPAEHKDPTGPQG